MKVNWAKTNHVGSTGLAGALSAVADQRMEDEK
jgi:hypothetical protein